MKKSRFTRLAAIVLAAATLWITAVTAGADSLRSAIAAVRDSARLPVALLRWELGDTFPMDALALPAMLALRESPLLLSAWAEVSSLPAPDDAAPVPEPDTSRKEPEETPQPSLPDAPRDDADNGAASQTIAPTSPSGFVQVGDVFIKNNSTKALDPAWFDGMLFAADKMKKPSALKRSSRASRGFVLSDDAPQVLIVHTHGSEAYTMPKGQEYAPTGTCRTADSSVNMIRVGDEIAAVLSSYGISVLHDRVLYDDPAYDGAYGRAADAIRGYLEKYPTLSFVLDVHRDAIEDKAGHQYKVITREDPRCAQISFVMGSNNDHWLENVKLAVAVQQRLTDTSPTLMRPMTLRNSNYNQHLTTGSMLVEIGTAGNSLSEALRAAQLFAMGFAQVVTEK